MVTTRNDTTYLFTGQQVKSVTCRLNSTYNQQIIFSLNFKTNGRVIAVRISYLTLVFTFSSVGSLPAFSQKADFAFMNLITSTFPVQTASALSSKNTILNLSNSFQTNNADESKNKLLTNAIITDCGEGTAAVNPPPTPSTEPGGSAVSPNTKVLNPERAYDADQESYSILYMDEHQKGVELSQFILFTAPASATDKVKLKLSLTAALLNSNDFTVKLQAYNGTTGVGTAIEITNLLTIYSDTKEFTLSPGGVFDRIKIGVLTNQNGSKLAQINVHYVTLLPPEPVFPGSTVVNGTTTSSSVQCEGSVYLSINNPDTNFEYKWYDSSNTFLTSGSSYSPSNLIAGNYTFYVSASRSSGCPESSKHQINLTVNPKAATPSITLTN